MLLYKIIIVMKLYTVSVHLYTVIFWQLLAIKCLK